MLDSKIINPIINKLRDTVNCKKKINFISPNLYLSPNQNTSLFKNYDLAISLFLIKNKNKENGKIKTQCFT